MMRYVALVCVFIEIFSEVNCTKSASLPFRNRLQSGFLGFGVDGMNDPSFSGNNLDSGFENRFPFNRRSFSLPDSPFMGRGNMGQFSMPGTSYRYGDLFSDDTPSVYNFPPSFMTGSRGNQMFDPFQSSGFNNFPSNGFDQIDPFGGFSPVSQNTMRDFPTRGFGSSIGNSFDDTINYPGIARIQQSTVIPGGVNSRFLSPRFGNPSGFDRIPLTRGGNGLGFNRFPLTRGGNGLGFNESPFSRMGDLSAIGGFPSTGNNLGLSGLAGYGSFPSARSNGLGIFG